MVLRQRWQTDSELAKEKNMQKIFKKVKSNYELYQLSSEKALKYLCSLFWKFDTNCKFWVWMNVQFFNDECQWRRSGVFIVNFEHISHLALVFLLLTLNM